MSDVIGTRSYLNEIPDKSSPDKMQALKLQTFYRHNICEKIYKSSATIPLQFLFLYSCNNHANSAV